MNSDFKVIGSTQLGIKPESTAPRADAFTTQPCELIDLFWYDFQLLVGYFKTALNLILSAQFLI